MKGGRLLAEVFRNRGYSVYPAPDEAHSKVPVASFITAIQLGCPQAMQIFCQAVQQNSPVGSYVLPVPGKVVSGFTNRDVTFYHNMIWDILLV